MKTLLLSTNGNWRWMYAYGSKEGMGELWWIIPFSVFCGFVLLFGIFWHRYFWRSKKDKTNEK
jgi:hypothetical protein